MGDELSIGQTVTRNYPSLGSRASEKIGKVMQVWKKQGMVMYLVSFPGCARQWYRSERLKKVERHGR